MAKMTKKELEVELAKANRKVRQLKSKVARLQFQIEAEKDKTENYKNIAKAESRRVISRSDDSITDRMYHGEGGRI
jgi:TolA-binding protein